MGSCEHALSPAENTTLQETALQLSARRGRTYEDDIPVWPTDSHSEPVEQNYLMLDHLKLINQFIPFDTILPN